MGLEHDIGELWVRLERLESAVFRRQSSEASKDDRSHFELVVEVLRGANGRFLAASQIAFAAGIDAGAVRTILYSHKSQFRAAKVGPRRVKWRLENADAPTFGTSQEETALTAGDKYPGFQNMNSEAAAEITRLRARLAAWKAEAEAWRQADDCDPMVRGECIREAGERRAATDAIEKEKA